MADIKDEKKDHGVSRTPSLEDKLESVKGSDIVPGSDGVTHDELATLPLVSDKLPLSAFLVVIVEFAERSVFLWLPLRRLTQHPPRRWSYYGTTNVFNNYIRAPLPRFSTTGAVAKQDRLTGVAGALGKGQPTSFALRTVSTHSLDLEVDIP